MLAEKTSLTKPYMLFYQHYKSLLRNCNKLDLGSVRDQKKHVVSQRQRRRRFDGIFTAEQT